MATMGDTLHLCPKKRKYWYWFWTPYSRSHHTSTQANLQKNILPLRATIPWESWKTCSNGYCRQSNGMDNWPKVSPKTLKMQPFPLLSHFHQQCWGQNGRSLGNCQSVFLPYKTKNTQHVIKQRRAKFFMALYDEQDTNFIQIFPKPFLAKQIAIRSHFFYPPHQIICLYCKMFQLCVLNQEDMFRHSSTSVLFATVAIYTPLKYSTNTDRLTLCNMFFLIQFNSMFTHGTWKGQIQ